MSNPASLEGRIAVVTGASRGLGLEMARSLASAGAHVFLNGSHADRAAAASARLTSEGLSVEPLAFDVGDSAAAKAALSRVRAGRGRLDILINNVGVRLREPIEKIDGAALRSLLDIDLVAPFEMSRAAADLMDPLLGGRIIMISSIQALVARRGDAAYITAKGGMISMTRALAAEFGPRNITCNCILPGSFATETNLALIETPQGQELARRRTFLGRYGRPEEIGGAAAFLASDAASYITGVTLPVDGGWTAAF